MHGWNIDTLPNEVISIITSFSDAYAIGKLWFCGNSRLNRILSNSVESFRLKYAHTERLYSALVWPRLLSQFMRLNELEIEVPPPFFNYAVVRDVNFSILSPTLRHIRLKFANSWLEILSANNALLPPPDRSFSPHSPSLPFKDRFFNLETLHSSAYLRNVSLNTSLFLTNISTPSLEHITSSSVIYLRQEDFKALVPTLSTLHCYVYGLLESADVKLVLPSCLTDLTIGGIESSRIIRFLPQTLTSLKLVHSLPLIASSDADFIPPSLTLFSASLTVFTCYFASKLPHTLKHLNLIAHIEVPTGTASRSPMTMLPPHLETLEGLFIAHPGMSMDWDPEATFYSPNILQSLPPKLRTLPDMMSTFRAEIVRYLPRSIQSLNLSELQPIRVAKDAKNRLESLASLPTSLTCLICQGLTHQEIGVLSNTLVTLSLDIWTFNMAIWNALSPLVNLKKLTVTTKWHDMKRPLFLTSPMILSEDDDGTDKLEGPILDHLIIRWQETVPTLRFDRKWASELKTLWVSTGHQKSIGKVEDFENWLVSLPHTLTNLTVMWQNEEVPLASLVHLPRTLTHLKLSHVAITDKTKLAVLPPLLTHLELSSSQSTLLKLADLAHWLPRQLVELHLPSTHAFESFENLDFTLLESQLPFLRGRIFMAPMTQYILTNQLLTNATEKYGVTYSFGP